MEDSSKGGIISSNKKPKAFVRLIASYEYSVYSLKNKCTLVQFSVNGSLLAAFYSIFLFRNHLQEKCDSKNIGTTFENEKTIAECKVRYIFIEQAEEI